MSQYAVSFADDPVAPEEPARPKTAKQSGFVVTFGDEVPAAKQHVVVLPLGATKRNPKGYDDEQTYLLAFRPRHHFTIRDRNERASHRRWANSAPSLVQQKLDEYRGEKFAAKLRNKAKLPMAEGHCPRLILGT